MEINVYTADTPEELGNVLDKMNKSMMGWTTRAARGECGWICSDCGCSFQSGMPDECAHGYQRCTEIIKRDKLRAMPGGEL